MQLTMQTLRPQRARLPKRDETCPRLGTEIEINLDYVALEDPEGRPRTPMAKARFDTKSKRWVQVPLSMAGILLFFQEPPGDNHKAARIKSVIPSGRACYVEPV